MGKHIKKQNTNHKPYRWVCPHCGNDAMKVMRKPTPVFCKYCTWEYTKEERVKEYM